MQRHSLMVDGHEMVYFTQGDPDSPLLLMVHGWGSYHGIWHSTMTQLSDQYYCVALDLLGFGESAKPLKGDYSIQAQARRVLALADSLGAEQFTLVGHSMGGMISLLIASELAPKRVLKLVDVAGVVGGHSTPETERRLFIVVRLAYYFPFMGTIVRWLTKMEWFANRILRALWGDLGTVPFEAWAQDRDMGMQPRSHIANRLAGDAVYECNLIPRLQHVTAPTLVIFGNQDGMVPILDGYLVEKYVPDSQFIRIDHCGHLPMYERSNEFLSAITVFLRDNPQGQPHHQPQQVQVSQ